MVHLSLHEYAIDHDGAFPMPVSTGDSNSAFRKLFDRKFQDERIFFVAGSAWHDSLPDGQLRPDNDVGQPPNYIQGLERGENHWAYISGLTNDSKGNLPIVADGFSDVPGVYSDDHDKRGGVWKGKKAIVVRLDGSAKFERPDGKQRIVEKKNGANGDIFSPAYGVAKGSIHNPLL